MELKFESNYLFYREHLCENEDHKTLICDFSPTNSLGCNVVGYLKTAAIQDEKSGIARTYLIRDCRTKELVGYYSISAGKIMQRQNTGQKRAISGIELVNFAVNNNYKVRHPFVHCIGERIFKAFILPQADMVQQEIGAAILYLYALPFEALIKYYESLGFYQVSTKESNYIYEHSKPSYDDDCVFMFMTLN